jgi:hypothetical protein
MSNPAPAVPPLRPGDAAGAASAWPWRAADPAREAAVRRRALRREGTTRAGVGLAVGGALFAFGARTLALLAWSLSGTILLAALASPAVVYAAIGRALERLGQLIGKLFAIVLLTPIFLLFFLPFGRLLRARRRDRLERWFDPQLATYWHRRREAARTTADYERAF